jgi:hypothetical protein
MRPLPEAEGEALAVSRANWQKHERSSLDGICVMIRTILLMAFLIALVFSGLAGGKAVAEVIDGSKLFADCRDGDNPNARDSTQK